MQSVRDVDNPFGRFRHVTGFPEELTRVEPWWEMKARQHSASGIIDRG
jgi:hypothetical protein